jgi:hypothetical protein
MATFDPTTPEVWYPIPGRPGYEISSHIRVRSFRNPRGGLLKKPHLMAMRRNKSGHIALTFRVDGRSIATYIHHVVAEMAHGPRPGGLNVLHRDDDKSNNWPDNLYYGTQAQNTRDAIVNGLFVTGQRRTQAKVTDDDVRQIRRLLAAGERQTEIGPKFGISSQLVNAIARGRRWAHVS